MSKFINQGGMFGYYLDLDHGALYPMYRHSLVPKPGKTYELATDQPPAHLKGFWPGDMFWVIPGYNGTGRMDSFSANSITGFDTCGPFSAVKYLNVRVK